MVVLSSDAEGARKGWKGGAPVMWLLLSLVFPAQDACAGIEAEEKCQRKDLQSVICTMQIPSVVASAGPRENIPSSAELWHFLKAGEKLSEDPV